MVNTQSCKLDLTGLVGNADVLHDPVVQGAVVLKLQRAQAVGDAFQRVLNGVRKVVERVDAPLVTLTVMVHMADAVDDGSAHIEVAGCQIDLGTERILVVLEFAGAHTGEQIQTFLNGTVTVGRNGGGFGIAAELLELLSGQLADVCQTLLDQLNSILVVLLEVVGAVEEAVAPVEAQPVDIFLDGFDKLHVFLGGVGVVHTQIAQTVILLGSAKVDGQRLAVTNVQIAVGLGRKAGMHSLTCILTALSDVLIDEGVDEIFAFSDFSHVYIHPLFWI